jgi:hypothetical protein
MGASVRSKPPNALRAKGVEKEEEEIKDINSRRAYVTIGELRNAHKTIFEEPEGKRPLGRLRHKWEDNIKTILKKQRVKSVD